MKHLPLHSLLFSDSKDTKIRSFLKAMPNLYFSDKGIENIAKRFNTSTEHLKNILTNLKGEQGNV